MCLINIFGNILPGDFSAVIMTGKSCFWPQEIPRCTLIASCRLIGAVVKYSRPTWLLTGTRGTGRDETLNALKCRLFFRLCCSAAPGGCYLLSEMCTKEEKGVKVSVLNVKVFVKNLYYMWKFTVSCSPCCGWKKLFFGGWGGGFDVVVFPNGGSAVSGSPVLFIVS